METNKSDTTVCSSHQQSFVAVCFTHKKLLCTDCLIEETHSGNCQMKSFSKQFTDNEQYFIDALKIIQKVDCSLSRVDRHVNEIRRQRQVVKGKINESMNAMIHKLNESARNSIQMVDTQADIIESTYNNFIKEVKASKSKLETNLDLATQDQYAESDFQNIVKLLDDKDHHMNVNMLECEFTVTDVKERIDELKEIGKVIFGEFEYYEAISHFEVPTSNTEKHSNLSVDTKMPKVNMGTQYKIAANTEVQRADTGTHTNVPVVTDEKRNISLSIRPDKKRSMCCSCFGSKYAMEDQTADYESPLEAANAEGYEIIHNLKINDIQEQIHKNTIIQNPSYSSEVDDNLGVYSDVTFTTLEIPNNKTTIVLYKNNDFQQKVSFKWVTDVKNGIIVYDEFEQTLVLTGTDGCVKVVHQIKEQPLALIRVSSERVTTLFVEGKACKMRCYFISDTAIKLNYANALPNEIQNQFLGAWYDILNEKYAVACNGTLYVLTAAGEIESKHVFKKRDGNWEGIRAAYDFHKRLLFVLDSRKKQLECQSIDKKEVVWEKTYDGEEFRPTNVCLTKDTLYIISGDQLIPVSCEDGTPTGDPIELEDLDENILACHFVEGKNAMILTTKSRTVGFLKLDRNQQIRVVKESADVNLTDINVTQF